MSLMRNSPILNSLSARRKHHIHTAPTDKNSPATSESTDKRERPFGELKFDADAKPTTPPAYKSIFTL